jgi:hypothetical protein
MWHHTHAKFDEEWFRHLKTVSGDIHTDSKAITSVYFYSLEITKSGYKNGGEKLHILPHTECMPFVSRG